jgi:hypothetical protein
MTDTKAQLVADMERAYRKVLYTNPKFKAAKKQADREFEEAVRAYDLWMDRNVRSK